MYGVTRVESSSNTSCFHAFVTSSGIVAYDHILAAIQKALRTCCPKNSSPGLSDLNSRAYPGSIQTYRSCIPALALSPLDVFISTYPSAVFHVSHALALFDVRVPDGGARKYQYKRHWSDRVIPVLTPRILGSARPPRSRYRSRV